VWITPGIANSRVGPPTRAWEKNDAATANGADTAVLLPHHMSWTRGRQKALPSAAERVAADH